MFLSLLDLLRRTGGLPDRSPASAPVMAVTDQGSFLQFKAELPGIDPKSVQVQVTESSLAIAGYGTREERTEGPNFYRMQAGVSSFYREMELPARIDTHRAAMQWQGTATLIITLPKL